MPATLDVSCPNCGKSLKVPAELAGKRVKCKGCDEVFPVPAPKAAAKPAAAKPAAKPAPKPESGAKPPPPPPPDKSKKPFLDDDDEDDGQAPKPMAVLKDDEAARCPGCAKELDPPDAEVCLNCGYNNRTRLKAGQRVVIENDAVDWLSHLAPGILALVLALGLIGGNIYAGINMRGWMEGSFLELDEKDLAGRKKMIVPPGAFIALGAAISAAVVVPASVFAFKRLILNATPPEKVKSKT